MIISKIIKIKSKYKIILTNETIITYIEVIINNNLLYKKEINNITLNKIKEETKYYDLYYKITEMISRKLKTEYELIKYLNNQNINTEIINKLINNLKINNYINDKRYVQAYINDKIKLTNMGPIKIKKELINKKINILLIEEELNKINNNIFVDKLEKQIDKKIKNNTKYSSKILKQKILIYYNNLGYKTKDIKDILSTKTIDDNNIEKEYKKLIKKYNDKNILKNKLYQKGYSINKINEITNKKDSY